MSRPHSRLRSIGAILLGMIAVVVLSLGTDQLMHALNIFPAIGQPMYDPGLNLLSLVYRTIYGVLGSYIAGRVAPYSPMTHALILGAVGFILSLAGAIVAIVLAGTMGPLWYPIGLVLTTLPGAWLGGFLAQKTGKTGDSPRVS